MLTLTAQAFTSLFLVLFGILACLVARRLPASEPVYRYAWGLTGGVFVVHGLSSTFHDTFSTLGFLGGAGSPAWVGVLEWHAPLNHSRTFLLTAYCVVLCAALVRATRRRPLPSLRVSFAVALGGMVVGGLMGWTEAKFSGLTHFTAVALWDVMELLATMAVLMVGLSTASLDRRLWACLGINAFALVLSVLWFTFLSRIDVVGEWRPRTYQIHMVKGLLYVVMNWLAFMQLRQVRRGIVLKSFYEDRTSRPAVPSLHG